MKVKICGLMSRRDIELCVEAGADALGFVTEYPAQVPWNLTAATAAELMRYAPPKVLKFMVTGGTPEKIARIAETARPDVVQLHHEETLSEVADTAKRLKKIGIRIVKALRVDEDGRLNFEISDINEAAAALEEAGVDALLIDSFTRERPGGTGRIVDAGAYIELRCASRLPVILAGGLTAENLRKTVSETFPPDMVDVLSGVERSPGIKDPEKTAAFIKSAHELFPNTRFMHRPGTGADYAGEGEPKPGF